MESPSCSARLVQPRWTLLREKDLAGPTGGVSLALSRALLVGVSLLVPAPHQYPPVLKQLRADVVTVVSGQGGRCGECAASVLHVIILVLCYLVLYCLMFKSESNLVVYYLHLWGL